MIDFRYHIVSLVAVFLALALGLFLGSTTLQGTVLNGIDSRVKTVTQEYDTATHNLGQSQQQVAQEEQFLQALAPYAVHDLLALKSVAIVSTPGVDGGTVDAVAAMLQSSAGATIAARVQLETGFFDPSRQTLLSSLSARLHVPGVHVSGGSGAARASAQLAAVLGAKPGRAQVSPSREQSVLSAYDAANLVGVSGGVGNVHPAALTVLLAPGPDTFDAAQRTADDGILVTLATDLAGHSAGTVLAGPAAAATDPSGALQVVTSAADRPADLATVRAVDTTAGQVSLAFALVEVFDGRSGDFGPGAATPLPTNTPSS